jgi:Domain of unknown function (DUF222)
MGWQRGAGNGAGGEPDPEPPDRPENADSSGSSGDPASGRDPRLSGFACGGEWDTCAPSAELAAVLADVSGADLSGQEWRCAGAEHDELFGLLRQWQALESWAVAGKLAVLRALIREDDQPLPGGGYHGDLPDGWTKSLTHEVALALAMPPQSAEKLMWTAWDLLVRLPKTGELLAGGVLTYAKARAVSDAFAVLTDEDAAKGETIIVPDLLGKTYGQAEKLADQAAITVDPDSASRRREDAERNRARVTLRRDPSGAASLAGYDLPTDETLAAHANVCTRAQEYKDAGAFPGVRMDQLRAMAYLDLMNGISAEARIACGQPPAGLGAQNDDGPASDADDPDTRPPDTEPNSHTPNSHTPGATGRDTQDRPDDEGPDGEGPDGWGPEGDDPDGGGRGADPGDDHPKGGGGPNRDSPDAGGPPASPTPQSSPLPHPPRLADLVIPLSTLLGLAERPGEGHGLGPLDPDLCRALVGTAVNSPHTVLCVTVTDPAGIAVGHGCVRPDRKNGPGRRVPPAAASQAQVSQAQAGPARAGLMQVGLGHSPPGPLAALPARLNLTIAAARLAELARLVELTRLPERAKLADAEPGAWSAGGPGAWSFTCTADPGPPGGYGTWELTLPDGRIGTVRLCCPAFKMPMMGALWVPMFGDGNAPPAGAAGRFASAGCRRGRRGAGVSR